MVGHVSLPEEQMQNMFKAGGKLSRDLDIPVAIPETCRQNSSLLHSAAISSHISLLFYNHLLFFMSWYCLDAQQSTSPSFATDALLDRKLAKCKADQAWI